MKRCIALLVALVTAGCAEGESGDPLAPQFSREASVPRALANGAVEFYGVEGVTRVAWEKYDFNAVRSGPGLEAHGHIAWNIRLFDGELSYGRAEVGCAVIVENTAWVAGPVTSIVIDGVSFVPPNGPRWAIMRVRDMGEGNGHVDVASILSFVPQNAVPLWCTLRLGPPPSGLLPEFPITRGNITVHSS